MGGGDLNTKKSWHPTNQRNQERVWKAEQKDAAEKKRLSELQREIREERDREDLRNIARNSGYIEDDPNKKLEWMYKGQELNREEYLTGRSIDKNFEQMSTAESQPQHPGIQVPKNHVEHEVIPFSIRQYKGIAATEQVDMARKLMEDPLMLIKQKEMETRRKILENPVKLKELHKILKQEKGKKAKKEKKKKRKRSKSSDSEEDLDQLLAQKYKKLQGVIQARDSDEEEMNLDKVLSTKFTALTKELDKMNKTKKKKKTRESSESDEFNVTKKQKFDSRRREPERRRTPERRSPRRRTPERRQCIGHRRSRSHERRRSPRRSQPLSSSKYTERRKTPEKRIRNRTRSPQPRYLQSHRNRSRTPKPRRKSRTPEKRKEPTPRRAQSSSSSSSSSRSSDSDASTRRPAKKNFGLVAANGKSVKLDTRRRTQTPPPRQAKIETKKVEVKRTQPAKLTEKQIEDRLREMRENASWREVERSEKVRRHREAEKREEDDRGDFDKDFLNKQLKKTANTMQTVESRIKSNINNIQRSSRVMDTHFARR